MFERFTRSAKRTVEGAQIQARALGHTWIGTEHLLLALLAEDLGVATRVLHQAGVDTGRFTAQLEATLGTTEEDWAGDADALRTIGIDLDEVRRRVEEHFGPGALDAGPRECKRGWRGGHIPFTPKSKRALELALREALRLGHKYIAGEHVLLGILRDHSALATRLLEELGCPPADLRDQLVEEMRKAS
jgi:ATP-dependent Clp protease ATP-binding subunit ClpA